MNNLPTPPAQSSPSDDLSYPEREALAALRDVQEDRPPAWISTPVEALDTIRERHDGERYGYLSIAVYVAVGFYTPYGGEELAATVGQIARAAGCSERSARRRLRILEELDLLEEIETKGGRGRPGRWRRPIDSDDRQARTPYWMPAAVSLSDDLDAAALALYAGMREHVRYDDGATVDVAAATLQAASLTGRTTFYGARSDLLEAGAVGQDDARGVYLTPRTPSENGILYLVDMLGLTDKGGHSQHERRSLTTRKAVTNNTRTRPLLQDRNEDTSVSSTRPFTLAGAGGRGRPRRTPRGEANSVGQRTETDDLQPSADSVPGRTTEGRSGAAAEESAPETWSELAAQLDDSPEFPSRDHPVQVAETPDGVPIRAWAEETEDDLEIIVVRAGERSSTPLPGYLDGLLPSIAFRRDFPTDAAEFFASLPTTLGSHPETGRPVKLHVSEFGPYLLHTGHDGEEGFGTVDVPLDQARSLEDLRGLSIEDAAKIIRQDRERVRPWENDPGPDVSRSEDCAVSAEWAALEAE